jgi:hypothetical protein
LLRTAAAFEAYSLKLFAGFAGVKPKEFCLALKTAQSFLESNPVVVALALGIAATAAAAAPAGSYPVGDAAGGWTSCES